MQLSEIKEASETSNGVENVKKTSRQFLKSCLKKQRSLLDLSGDAGDEGTNSLMSDYIREQEKLVWDVLSFSKIVRKKS